MREQIDDGDEVRDQQREEHHLDRPAADEPLSRPDERRRSLRQLESLVERTDELLRCAADLTDVRRRERAAPVRERLGRSCSRRRDRERGDAARDERALAVQRERKAEIDQLGDDARPAGRPPRLLLDPRETPSGRGSPPASEARRRRSGSAACRFHRLRRDRSPRRRGTADGTRSEARRDRRTRRRPSRGTRSCGRTARASPASSRARSLGRARPARPSPSRCRSRRCRRPGRRGAPLRRSPDATTRVRPPRGSAGASGRDPGSSRSTWTTRRGGRTAASGRGTTRRPRSSRRLPASGPGSGWRDTWRASAPQSRRSSAAAAAAAARPDARSRTRAGGRRARRRRMSRGRDGCSPDVRGNRGGRGGQCAPSPGLSWHRRTADARPLPHDSAGRRRGRRAHRPDVPAREGRVCCCPGWRRRGGAAAIRRAARRPGRARPDAAAARRARGLQAAAGDEHGADHHADRARRRARQGARPRARRRRLHHQAVLDPRVPLACPCAAAPRPPAARAGGRGRVAHRSERARDRFVATDGRGARTRR